MTCQIVLIISFHLLTEPYSVCKTVQVQTLMNKNNMPTKMSLVRFALVEVTHYAKYMMKLILHSNNAMIQLKIAHRSIKLQIL